MARMCVCFCLCMFSAVTSTDDPYYKGHKKGLLSSSRLTYMARTALSLCICCISCRCGNMSAQFCRFNFAMIQFHRFRSTIMLTSWLTHRFGQTWGKLVIILETSNKSLHTCLWIDTFYGFKL